MRTSPPKRSAKHLKRTPVKKKNIKRRKSEFIRCYHSKERVEFVQSLACSACHVVGASQNAHVLGNGGMGRKADYTTIAPLCGPRFGLPRLFGGEWCGCHRLFDESRIAFDLCFPDFDAAKAAAATQQAWIAFQGEET